MIKKILNLFSSTIYVKVYKNKISAKNIETNTEITSDAIEPFTTTRLLVGDFINAENLLRNTLQKAGKNKFSSPVVVIQPMEMMEGGLSEVETRVLRELANGAGARKAAVWTGEELSDEEVIQRVKDI